MGSLLAYTGLSAVYLRPIWRLFATHLAPDPYDPGFNRYLLEWGHRAMERGLRGFWDAPFFFPEKGVTTLSDHLLGPAAATLPLLAHPIAAYNFLFFLSFALSGWTAYLVLSRCGLSARAAFLGGCFFTFSHFRWQQLSHLPVLLMLWIPPTLWAWDRLLERPTWRRAGVFLLFYGPHVAGGNYLAYMIHLPLFALLLVRGGAAARRPGDRNRARFGGGELRVLAAVALACVTLLIALYLPYVRAAGRPAHEHRAAEVRRYAASVASLLTPSEHSIYGGWVGFAWRRDENSLFPGFVATALLAVAAAAGWRRWHTPAGATLSEGRTWALRGLLALTALAWLAGEEQTWSGTPLFARLSFERAHPHYQGPALVAALAVTAWAWLRRRWAGSWPWHLGDTDARLRGLLLAGSLCLLAAFPLVYVPLMSIVPGLAGMRVPTRFFAFVSFAVAAFAGVGFDLLRQRAVWARSVTFWLSVCLLTALDLAPRRAEWTAVPERLAEAPPVYSWLAGRGDVTALLELPIGPREIDEIRYLDLAALHGKPLVNGYSSSLPASYVAVRSACRELPPAPACLDLLRGRGVSHLVLHLAGWKRQQRKRLWAWEDEARLAVLYWDGTDRVYAIGAGASGAAPTAAELGRAARHLSWRGRRTPAARLAD